MFTDVSATSGVDFMPVNGASGRFYEMEPIGSGGALLDWDGDGDLDLYLLDGAALPGRDYEPAPRNVLYENVTAGGALRFRRVEDAAGAAHPGYGMGAAVGDYDNDGDPDLFLSNYGPNVLYRNDGGRFTDVTGAAGLGDDGWGTSAVWVDVDNDGLLDLYVGNYFDYRAEDEVWHPRSPKAHRIPRVPGSFRGTPDLLYRNRGDGTFEDVSETSGVRDPIPSHALGVVAGDFDDDGDVDIYVANDAMANFLFLNDGSGRFVDDAVLAGCAFDQGGRPQAGMGVDAGDYDADGLIDLFCTNFSQETNTLYRGEGGGFFSDVSYPVGVGAPSLPLLAFGTGFFDFDHDRDLDLFVANGHILEEPEIFFDGTTFKERNQLFVNDGAGRFVDALDWLAPADAPVEASRAALFGDLDEDGDLDLVVTNMTAAPQVLRNDAGSENGWVRVALEGVRSNRDGYGAEVLVTVGGDVRRYQARSGYSYLASCDPRVVAGLGGAPAADEVEIRWPSGTVDRFSNVPGGTTLHAIEGTEVGSR